jgi:hypothetical protein
LTVNTERQEEAMFVPAPIDMAFVPYTKRRVLKHNAGLFVDGTGGTGGSASRVAPQFDAGPCFGKKKGARCGPDGMGYCNEDNGYCVL